MDTATSISHTNMLVSHNAFTSLAPELKQAIFSALPDTSSLVSLVLTCSSFYHTFFMAEPLIVKAVLHNQIGADLMFDAMIVFGSTKIIPNDYDTVFRLLQTHAKRDPTYLSTTWKLREAFTISELHGDVETFSNGFASSALSTNPVTGLQDEPHSPLSVQECTRIKRTFYRFEFFCNIFCKYGKIAQAQQILYKFKKLFFASCAPWENEQLACVREYLFDCLSIRMCSSSF